jgi:hypothetical protein
VVQGDRDISGGQPACPIRKSAKEGRSLFFEPPGFMSMPADVPNLAPQLPLHIRASAPSEPLDAATRATGADLQGLSFSTPGSATLQPHKTGRRQAAASGRWTGQPTLGSGPVRVHLTAVRLKPRRRERLTRCLSGLLDVKARQPQCRFLPQDGEFQERQWSAEGECHLLESRGDGGPAV